METKTRSADASEFYLVLTPTWGASSRASEAIHERFKSLGEETCGDLAAVVSELVQNSVDKRPDHPITVSVAVEGHSIHGEISDQGNPSVSPRLSKGWGRPGIHELLDRLTSRWNVVEGRTDVWFEMPLAR